jgi:hypothetical protein
MYADTEAQFQYHEASKGDLFAETKQLWHDRSPHFLSYFMFGIIRRA